MFGRRPDGKRIKDIDPIVRMTPYLMPMRCDAQVFLSHNLDYEVLARYIAEQAKKGERITFMNIIIAAYVRAVSQYPAINRFIMNKQYYSRTNCTTAFTILNDPQDADKGETAVKIKFDLTDTIYDVRDRMQQVIDSNRGVETKNAADNLVSFLFGVPGLPTVVVGIVRLLDRYGLCPGALLDIIPFHTGMFITNNASIGLHHVNHHIYNFGNTSIFLGMGTVLRQMEPDGKGGTRMKRWLPIGITVDERVCSGAHFAGFFSIIKECFADPSILETPPEKVLFDPGCEYHQPKPVKA